MSAPRFRVGDVVRVDTTRGGDDVRVVEGVDLVDNIITMTNREHWLPAGVTLLRRPVQVGDVLRTASGSPWKMYLADLHVDYAVLGWTHEDGTPIEPPQPVEAFRDVACRCGEHVRCASHICGCACHDLDGRQAKPPQPVAEVPAQTYPSTTSTAKFAVPPPPAPPAPRRPRMLLIDRLGFERIQDYDGGYQHIRVASDDTEVMFEPYREVERDGEWFYEYREKTERTGFRFAPPPTPPPALPDVDTLARALFDTDPEVLAFVEQVSDAIVCRHVTRWNAVTMCADTVHDIAADAPDRLDRALQRAWDRDEHGWATRATTRAEAALAKLGGA